MKPGRLRRIAICAGVPPALGLLLAALAPLGWFPAQLAAHWAAHLAVLALPLWCALGRRAAGGAAMLALAGAALWPHIVAAYARTAPAPGASSHVVASANLYYFSDGHDAPIATLAAYQPDILLLIETQDADRGAMRGDARWPHQAWQSPRHVGGMGLLSRWPMKSRAFMLADATTIDARVETPDGPLRILACHTWSPRDARRVEINRRQLEQLARLATDDPGPLLVMGDLNATPATPGLRTLLAAGMLIPHGGEVRTWPSWLGPFGIGIDHVLGRGLHLGDAEPVDLQGSDHHAIVARFALPDR